MTNKLSQLAIILCLLISISNVSAQKGTNSFGIVYEPNFTLDLGLSTGLFYDYFFTDYLGISTGIRYTELNDGKNLKSNLLSWDTFKPRDKDHIFEMIEIPFFIIYNLDFPLPFKVRTDLVTGYSLGYSLVDIVKTYYTGSWPMVQQETKTQNFIHFYSIGFEMSYSMNEKLYISTGPMFRFGINGKEPFSNDIISISWKLKIGLAYS